MEDEKPRLRADLQPVRAQVDGRDVIMLRDPLALSSQVIAMGGGAVALLNLLDGTHDVGRLRLLAIQLSDGNMEAGDDLEHLLEVLDERCLLDNERYRAARRSVVMEWNAQIDRPCAFAGAAYPDSGADLSRFLDEILDGAPEPRGPLPDGRLVALVAPHVDIHKGWPLYGAAYRLLSDRMPDLDRILVLGTGHTMQDGLLCPTSKHYLTPLGRASTDLDFIERLRVPDGDGGGDFPHRGEHSIEFQVIFLQHVYAEQLAPLVPVLCGNAEAHLGVHRPSGLPGVGGALESMRDALAGRTLAVAGVDLSHVGPKFGDEEPSSAILPDALEHETALLDALERADAEAFWSEARRVSDRHHVCGLTALGFLLEILPPGARGVLLGRDVMREHDTSSAVGFASLAFFG